MGREFGVRIGRVPLFLYFLRENRYFALSVCEADCLIFEEFGYNCRPWPGLSSAGKVRQCFQSFSAAIVNLSRVVRDRFFFPKKIFSEQRDRVVLAARNDNEDSGH